jgi:hypothetical protein
MMRMKNREEIEGFVAEVEQKMENCSEVEFTRYEGIKDALLWVTGYYEKPEL